MAKIPNELNPPLSAKDRIDVLLHEYDSLRTEILERHSVLTQSVGFSILILGAILGLLWNHWLFCAIAIVLTCGILYLEWWRVELDTAAAALRVCELENTINQIANERLLEWETKWGVLSPQFPIRDQKVRFEISALRARRKDMTQRERRHLRALENQAAVQSLLHRTADWLSLRAGLVAVFVAAFVVATVIALAMESGGDNTISSSERDASMSATGSPDERATAIVRELTLDEKIQLTSGVLARSILPSFPIIYRAPTRSLGGAGFVPGIKRLGLPDLQIADAGCGVTVSDKMQSTALPCPLALAATWNRELARSFGETIGREARANGFNMVLGGAVNLVREPRSGRAFENHGEDPVLAGTLVAEEIKGIQSQRVIATIKHFALNDQETGRYGANAIIETRALRESDLLAFELGVTGSDVGTVMCAYNQVNGVYSCENAELLTNILKGEWGFKGWVVSDWGATHSTVESALAGLDQEQPFDVNYGGKLRQAIDEHRVPISRLDDMVHRIVRTMYAIGVVDAEPASQPSNSAGMISARRIEQEAVVLLKNSSGQLPLDPSKKYNIAVIGSHADVAVLSGGGSSQIVARGESPVATEGVSSPYFDPIFLTARKIWMPSSPLEAIRERAPSATVRYESGQDLAAAKRLATESDVVLLFSNQWRSEGVDLTSLRLSPDQDHLIDEVSAINPHTVVILETGGAVLMPWLSKVGAVLEAWYPGIEGGNAIADVLFGVVNPSGKLPITFPSSDSSVPHPTIATPPYSDSFYNALIKPFLFRSPPTPPQFPVPYDEGMSVGYKWYDSNRITPLFPFGFGISYTGFEYSNLGLSLDNELHVTFVLRNTGQRGGAEIAQVYLDFPPASGEPPRRLIGWTKVLLEPAESRLVTLTIPRKLLSIWNVVKKAWEVFPGHYRVVVGSSSRDIRLDEPISLAPS